jgi:large subunit ribosomal protein L19
MMDIIQSIENEQIRNDLDHFDIGDYVRVHLKIKEGSRERVQVFEGTVIARQGKSVKESFTVRRVSYGVGVERVIPVHSPNIHRIEVVRKGKVRRAKLYYLRDRVGKAAKVRTKLQSKAKKNKAAGLLDAVEPELDTVTTVDANE